MLHRYLCIYVTYLIVNFMVTDETTTVADYSLQEDVSRPQKTKNSSKCLCGTFPSSQIEGIKTVLTHAPELDIQCDIEGEMTCKKICTALAEAAKAEGPKLICNKLITGKVVKLYAFYKICGKPWLFIKNVTNWDSFCCEDGKITVCAGEANMGNCSCGAFVTQSPRADDPPLFFQAIGIVKCDIEGEVDCRKKCLVAAAENKNSVENLLCTELETAVGLKISAFYKFCEKPWTYQENMTAVVCCTNHKVTDCEIHYGNCSCGGFLSQNLIETMAPVMALDSVSAVTCDEAGDAACLNNCGALVNANKEYAADFLCSKLINSHAMELRAYYKTCEDIWNRMDLSQLVCCANSTVCDCNTEEKVGKCICGAFLTESPADEENPLLSQDDAAMVPCNKAGEKACLKKCKATADLIENTAVQLCGKLKTVNVSMVLSTFYKACVSPWTFIEHASEICCVNGSSVVCSSEAEYDRLLKAIPTSRPLARRPLQTRSSSRKCTCGAFLAKTSILSNAPLSQYINVFTNITCDNEGELICKKICTTLAIENEVSAASKLCAKLENVYGLKVLVFYKACEKSWTYVDITTNVCCENSIAVKCISGAMRPTVYNQKISNTQSDVVDKSIDTTKGDHCSCVAFLTREPNSDIKPSLMYNIGPKVIECAQEKAENTCKSRCVAVVSKYKAQAVNKLCIGQKTYTELELSAFYKICDTSWTYTGVTEEFCCEGGQTVVCATGFDTLLSGLENFFGPTAPALAKPDIEANNVVKDDDDAQINTNEAWVKAEASRGDCSCGAFLSETPIKGELPIVSQVLDPNAPCDEQGRTVCVKSCFSLATATKFHAVYQLCTELKTANDLKLSAFYKLCEKPWTYIDMTETVCCKNGAVIPCASTA